MDSLLHSWRLSHFIPLEKVIVIKTSGVVVGMIGDTWLNKVSLIEKAEVGIIGDLFRLNKVIFIKEGDVGNIGDIWLNDVNLIKKAEVGISDTSRPNISFSKSSKGLSVCLSLSRMLELFLSFSPDKVVGFSAPIIHLRSQLLLSIFERVFQGFDVFFLNVKP
jgi:hypothetical protein